MLSEAHPATSNPAPSNMSKKKLEPSLPIRSFHNPTDIRNGNRNVLTEEATCPMCAFKTRDAGVLEAHFNSSHMEGSFTNHTEGSFTNHTEGSSQSRIDEVLDLTV